MDNKIKLDIRRNAEATLRNFKGGKEHPQFIEQARKRWISYTPTEKKCISVAIDGGMNVGDFQGINIWLADAVAVDSGNRKMPIGKVMDGQPTGFDWEYGITPMNRGHLLDIMNKREFFQSTRAMKFHGPGPVPELILFDGSLTQKMKFHDFELEDRNVKQHEKTMHEFADALATEGYEPLKKAMLFISKNSTVTDYFTDWMKLNNIKDQPAADLYYFNQIPKEPGFSIPYQNPKTWDDFKISVISFFARLRKDAVMLRIEMANVSGPKMSQEEFDNLRGVVIPQLLDKLYFLSVRGYPSALQKAHDNATISHDDMNAIAQIYNMQFEPGAREALGE